MSETVHENSIIRVTTWAELEALPGYVGSISKHGISLGRIRGKYAMKGQELRPCAIDECRTPHIEGAVISLADGRKTHIGQRCGKKYFAEQWDRLYADFKVRSTAAQNELQLVQMHSAVAAIEAQLNHIQPLIDEFKALKTALDTKLPRHVLDELYRRAERGDLIISRARALTAAEREIREVSEQRLNSGVVEEEIGRLSGLQVLNLSNDPWHICTYTLRNACKAANAVQNVQSPSYRMAAKRWTDCSPALARVYAGISLSQSFFSNANLSEILKLQSSRSAGLVRIVRAIDGGLEIESSSRAAKKR